MNSDIYIISVDYKEGFELEVARIAKLQAARDQPRTLISAVMDQAFVKLVLIFELVQAKSLTTP